MGEGVRRENRREESQQDYEECWFVGERVPRRKISRRLRSSIFIVREGVQQVKEGS